MAEESSLVAAAKNTTYAEGAKFPTDEDQSRLNNYDYYSKLFMGEHFDAFNIKIDDPDWTKSYGKLRYVMVNFAGLISKICADMLYSEPVTPVVPDGDQDFIEKLWFENQLNIQLYESALSNSYFGDALFKLRIDKRTPNEKPTIIIEDITPRIYFPDVNGFNVRKAPEITDLAWKFKKEGDNTTEYLRKEIHNLKDNTLTNKVYVLENGILKSEENISMLGIPGLKSVQKTNIDRSLLVHVPNWKTGERYFGITDYYDLDSLFFGINNRMTKSDNILDKHSDPILMVPQGVLDSKGNVKKKALGVIEIEDGADGKPEYIVWDASLENAFKHIEKMVEFIYLTGEISPDILGLGKGVSDSGRALKFKLMRTIAKVARKKLYYDRAIKEVLHVAQILAKEWGVEVQGTKLKGKPVVPELKWQDGLPIDENEQIETESKAIDAGITTKKAASQRVYGLDEASAEKLQNEVSKETKIDLPKMNNEPNFGKPKK